MSPSPQKPFICGVVEGFYGKPWTMKQRAYLFPRIAKFGMDTYMYAPKDDFKHRSAWRVLYMPSEAEQLKRLIDEAKAHHIKFIYAISPGLDMVYSSDREMDLLKSKLDQVSSLGCESFAILFDDIEPQLLLEDREKFESAAHAQAFVANEIYQHLKAPSTFIFCPTEYCESYCQPSFTLSTYLPVIGAELNLGIEILWTGPRVISKHISCASIRAVNKVLRRPVLIWDNIHANDYDQRRVFMGPYAGRSPALVSLLSGVLTNPNCEFEVNFVPLHTLATWSRISIGTVTDKDKDDNVEDAYDPSKALATAVADWLPQFSVAENFTTEIPLLLLRNEDAMDTTESLSNTDKEEAMSVESYADKKSPEGKCEVTTFNEPMTLEDVYLLCDLFYLPYQHGSRAVEILQELSWLVNYNRQCGIENSYTLSEEWKRKLESFFLRCTTIDTLVNKIDGPNRSLQYEIHPYIREVQKSLSIARKFLSKIEEVEEGDNDICIQYAPCDPEPWVFQGGLGAEVMRILPPSAFKEEEVLKRPVENPSAATCVFLVRPYCEADREALYKICLLNSDNGQDGSHLFPDFPDIIGDRGVGPYLEFQPELAYVLTDDQGVCGYVLGVVDTIEFYDSFYSIWLPKMCEKYPAPTTDKSSWSSTEEISDSFHNPPKFIIPEVLSGPYPSHIKFNLLTRAQGKGMGESLITCVLQCLKQKGSRGVHLDISPDDIRHLNIYTSLGFAEIKMNSSQVFLGKTFDDEEMGINQ